MDKQQIAHSLETEIESIDKALYRLQYVYNHTTDDFQARDLNIAINGLIIHKKNLQKIIVNIVQDAKQHNPRFDR